MQFISSAFHYMVRVKVISLDCCDISEIAGDISYLQFLNKEEMEVLPSCDIVLSVGDGWLSSKEYNGEELFCVCELGEERDHFFIETPLFKGEIFLNGSHYCGSFTLAKNKLHAIDNIIALFIGLLCEENGNFLLHSSAVMKDGKAYLFLGHGGAGKTTIAVELNGGRTPLSVDRTLVAFEEDGTPIAHSTPFGDRNKDLPGPASAPIAGIFFIEQADVHEVSPVDPFEATRLILAQTIAPTRTRETVQKVMDAVGKLVDRGMCYKLRFRKDDGFWPLIETALSK